MTTIDKIIEQGSLEQIAKLNPAVDVDQLRDALSLVQSTEGLVPKNHRCADSIRPFSTRLERFLTQSGGSSNNSAKGQSLGQ